MMKFLKKKAKEENQELKLTKEDILESLEGYAERYCLKAAVAVRTGKLTEAEAKEFVMAKMPEAFDKVMKYDDETLRNHCEADEKANLLSALRAASVGLIDVDLEVLKVGK